MFEIYIESIFNNYLLKHSRMSQTCIFTWKCRAFDDDVVSAVHSYNVFDFILQRIYYIDPYKR